MNEKLGIDFTGRDYDSLVATADRLATQLVPEWTSRDDNDINWATIKIVALLCAYGNMYIDLAVTENDPFEVQLYKNVIKMARRVGMPVKRAVGATMTLNVTIAAHSTTETLKRGETVFKCNGISYVLLEDAIFPPDVNEKVCSVQYGEWSRIPLGTSTGEELMDFTVRVDNVQDRAVRVFITEVDEEEEWSVVDTLLMSYSKDTHFRMVLWEDYYYHIGYGDNKSGKVPAVGSKMYAEVLTLPSNCLAVNYGNMALGNSFTCSASNVKSVIQSSAATGGYSGDSLHDVAWAIPQWVSTANRCIADEDYVYLAKRVPGVADAMVFHGDTSGNNTVGSNLIANVYIVPVGGGVASPVLMRKVEDYLVARKIDIKSINILVPTVVPIKLRIEFKVKSNVYRENVRGKMLAKAQEYLNVSNQVGRLLPETAAWDILNDDEYKHSIVSGKVTVFCRADGPDYLGDISLDYDEVSSAGAIELVATGGLI